MSKFEIDTVIVGCGVVGLGIAHELRNLSSDLLMLEADEGIGRCISSRNSGVIHAGIYYPKDSLKARLCVQGKDLLYRHCEKYKVPFSKTGKLIVATSDAQIMELQEIREKALQNCVDDLCFLNKSDVKELEPELDVKAGLLSPSTGIVDPISFMLSLQGSVEENGVQFAFGSRFKGAEHQADGRLLLLVENQGDEIRLICKRLINAAGLASVDVRNNLPFAWGKSYRMGFARGNYFSYSRKTSFRRLIYPVPEEHGLGIHLTLNLANEAIFGPDVDWIDKIDFSVNEGRKPEFVSAIRKYFPTVQPDG
ncbi:FAD-dependent oxidoreductase, partial [Alphaproteobacteria bacterium]|nr:FAD-dependent oxidoreductase [Alphaproteobacteria bacterium]